MGSVVDFVIKSVYLSFKGEQKPPDSPRNAPALQHLTDTSRFLEDQDTMFPRFLDKQVYTDLATSPPDLVEKRLMFPSSLVHHLKMAMIAEISDRVKPENTIPAEKSEVSSRVFKRLKKSLASADSGQPDRASVAGRGLERQARANPVTAGPDRREKILKMLNLMEGLQKTYNSTLNASSRLCSFEVSIHGSPKTTTLSPVDSSGTANRTSTDPLGPSGKPFKKSPPPSGKKNNKRVCFWKYCSQN
uniref:Uncharacterized protein n=1 Tax=Denticeps clupeoides TaxID=299321 RepID=A0AAY4A8L0_9TELE